VLVENEFGVLAKVASLFAARGYNIASLCVAETMDPTVSRMTIVTSGEKEILEQITKQLNKLVNVLKVTEFSDTDHVEREMAMIKVNAESSVRAEVLRIVDIFRAKVIDVSPRSYTLEVTGNDEKIKAVLELLKPLGIKEMARTGAVAMPRDPKGGKGARSALQE
jgi:acetolactate synthase-1/3 small subunit